jgi:hypothetical protein
MKGYVYVQILNTQYEEVSIYVVNETKLESFLSDKYALFGIIGTAYIYSTIECLNGMIGKGDFIKCVEIKY